MKKIRIGHIGVSHDHAGPVLQCVLSYPELFEFVGWAEDNEENYKRKIVTDPVYDSYPRYTSKELIDLHPDAMLVEGYELDNLDVALRCVENGIHIHMDKPAGADLKKFKRVLDIAREKGVAVHMGYMYRYNSAVRRTLDLIANGTLGEVYSVQATMNTRHDPEKRAWMRDFPAGDMFFLGCHMVDLIHLFMGRSPRTVYPFNRRSGFGGVDVTDVGCAVLDYGNAVSIAQATSVEVGGFSRRQVVVCGTKATVEIKPLETQSPTMPIGSELWIATAEMADGGHDYDSTARKKLELPPMKGRYDDMMVEFAAIVRGDIENPFDYEYEYEVQRLVLEACKE